MIRAMVAALAFVVALVAAYEPAAQAQQQRLELSTFVDTDTVEVGDSITYTQKAVSHGGAAPSDPRPGSTPGFSVKGVSQSPMHMRMSVNGTLDEINGLVTTWSLRADRVGTFTLGPSQVTVGGSRQSSTTVRVRVVEKGKGGGRRPQRPTVDPFGASPLDPFKSLFDFGDDDHPSAPVLPSADPKLGMDEARAPVAFLHATIDKPRAVVGEQVTLSVYLYEDPYARQGRPGDVHEATANEFVKRSLMDDETRAVGVGTAMVGGKLWNVKLVRKNALFPLKTGHLVIEPMSMTLPQARVGLRASETLSVDVAEPPVAGRPAGYAVGDVGDFALQASVTPRAIPRDGAIGVTVELRGTGNLPSSLQVPVVPGVEWLEPQTRDKLGAMQNDRFGGTRTFAYVVRVHKEGAVDLGEIRLPYYDADKRSYGLARAAIGIVNVENGPARDAGADEPEIVLANMPKERHALEGVRAATYWTERPAYWAALFGSPLACALALGAHGLLGRMRERKAAAAPSAERVAKTRRAEAEAALRGEDGKLAMGAIARAVEAEALLRTGVNVRGADGATTQAELEEAGVAEADAKGVLAVLRECEDARFSPDGIGIEAARATWTRARAAVDALPSAPRGAA